MAAGAMEQGGGVSRSFSALHRHYPLVIVMTLIWAVAFVLLGFLRPPIYQATRQISFDPNGSIQKINAPSTQAVAGPDADRLIAGQLQVLTSEQVVAAAAEILRQRGIDVSPQQLAQTFDVSQLTATNVIEVTARDRQQRVASEIADSLVSAYVADRVSVNEAQLQAEAAQLSARMSALQTTIVSLDQQVAQKDPSAVMARDAAVADYGSLSENYQTVLVNLGLQDGGVSTITQAYNATNRASPGPAVLGLAGAVVGALIGIGLAFVLEYFAVARQSRRREDLVGSRPNESERRATTRHSRRVSTSSLADS